MLETDLCAYTQGLAGQARADTNPLWVQIGLYSFADVLNVCGGVGLVTQLL